jgi:hypothetical protein
MGEPHFLIKLFSYYYLSTLNVVEGVVLQHITHAKSIKVERLFNSMYGGFKNLNLLERKCP